MNAYEWTDEQRRAWEEWVLTRPPVVADLCRRFPCNVLFRLKSSGHRVTVSSYSEDGTLTVLVAGRFNLVPFECRVFGVPPEDLTECDLPSPEEPLGAMLTESADIDAFVEIERGRRIGESIESMVRALA